MRRGSLRGAGRRTRGWAGSPGSGVRRLGGGRVARAKGSRGRRTGRVRSPVAPPCRGCPPGAVEGSGDAREALVEDVAHGAQGQLFGALQLELLRVVAVQEILHQVHLGLDHAELVLAHARHDQAGVLRVLGQMEGPGLDAALGEVPLVEGDLLGLDLLQLQFLVALLQRQLVLLAALQDRLLVLPALLLEGQLLLLDAVRHRTLDLEGVLPAVAAVHLHVDLRAALGRPHLLGRRVVDRLEAALVVDVLLVAAQPQGPGRLEAGRGAQRPQDVDRLVHCPFGRRAVRDREALAHRTRRALEFADQQARHVPVTALHEPGRVDDLPGHVDLGRELERVVVTGQRQRAGERVHTHVDLVHSRVAPRRDLAARRAAGREVGLVAALGGREDERVVDTDRRLQ